MWEKFPKPGYVANPRRGSNHNRGAAVDLTLTTLDGREVEMPTPYDSFERAAHQGYTGGTLEAREHRKLLRSAMESAGFGINRSEWWHYDAPGALKLPVRDEPLVAVEDGG
jgi:D-alanyl-D-alanine dipeptidase